MHGFVVWFIPMGRVMIKTFDMNTTSIDFFILADKKLQRVGRTTAVVYVIWALLWLLVAPSVYADRWMAATPKGEIPSARSGHTMVCIGTMIYLFGGKSESGELLNDLYCYDASRNRWFREVIETSPPPAREGHTAVAYFGKMFIFFGRGSGGDLDDIWCYNPATKSWYKPPSKGTAKPEGRFYHATAVCRDWAIIYGGRQTQNLLKTDSSNQILGDTWRYNLKDGTWVKGSVNPHHRYGHSMVCSGVKVYSFGGATEQGITSDLWVYDPSNNTWSEAAPMEGMLGRVFHLSTYDDENKIMYIWGGSTRLIGNGPTGLTTELGETWSLDLNTGTWTKKAEGPPLTQAAGVFIPASQLGSANMVVFGGLSNTSPQQDTFIYQASDAAPIPGVYIVVLGSSTAEGTGPQDPHNAWVNRYRDFLKSENVNHQVINLAKGGYTTYHILPTNQSTPSYRPKPDPQRNITYALSLMPDAIIINLPSNDASSNYSVAEQLQNYDSVLVAAWSQKVPVWITTTQPRNLSETGRKNLMEMRDSTFSRFGKYAIDFWSELAQSNGMIQPQYDCGDGIHLNDAAHAILCQRVIAKDIHRGLMTRARQKNGIPTSARIVSNYPNPFNSATRIEFEIDAPVELSYQVFNIAGQLIFSMPVTSFSAGVHHILLDATEWSSGIYFYYLKVGHQVLRGKLTCIK